MFDLPFEEAGIGFKSGRGKHWNSSEKGCVLYSDKIYKDQSLLKVCDEFNLDPISVIMSGGEDYEILFTINSSDYEKIENSDFDLHVIGHITNDKKTYL